MFKKILFTLLVISAAPLLAMEPACEEPSEKSSQVFPDDLRAKTFFKLAETYYYGIGQPKDIKKAADFYIKILTLKVDPLYHLIAHDKLSVLMADNVVRDYLQSKKEFTEYYPQKLVNLSSTQIPEIATQLKKLVLPPIYEVAINNSEIEQSITLITNFISKLIYSDHTLKNIYSVLINGLTNPDLPRLGDRTTLFHAWEQGLTDTNKFIQTFARTFKPITVMRINLNSNPQAIDIVGRWFSTSLSDIKTRLDALETLMNEQKKEYPHILRALFRSYSSNSQFDLAAHFGEKYLQEVQKNPHLFSPYERIAVLPHERIAVLDILGMVHFNLKNWAISFTCLKEVKNWYLTISSPTEREHKGFLKTLCYLIELYRENGDIHQSKLHCLEFFDYMKKHHVDFDNDRVVAVKIVLSEIEALEKHKNYYELFITSEHSKVSAHGFTHLGIINLFGMGCNENFVIAEYCFDRAINSPEITEEDLIKARFYLGLLYACGNEDHIAQKFEQGIFDRPVPPKNAREEYTQQAIAHLKEVKKQDLLVGLKDKAQYVLEQMEKNKKIELHNYMPQQS